MADPLQRDSGGEPADAAADDQRANRRLPGSWPRVGCTMPAQEFANSRLNVCSRTERQPIFDQREVGDEVPFLVLIGGASRLHLGPLFRGREPETRLWCPGAEYSHSAAALCAAEIKGFRKEASRA